MKDSALALMESTLIPSVDLKTENTVYFNNITTLSESAFQRLGYTPQKVIVVQNPDDTSTYMVEFSGNLERLMNDQDIDINEAMEMVAEDNNLIVSDMILVLDESAKFKLNISEIIKSKPEYSIVRY